ncbi:hypothetical protein ACAG24_001725 [Mycobacterium sp. pW049]|uniref:hypothetical protein n=1 Tax=[Mycobacterium] bulgaricum TaxID=3238985 RepID=UPI00351ABA2A
MGSRARIATASCFVATGLLVGGLGTATAFADPGPATGEESAPSEGRHTSKRHRPPRAEDAGGDPAPAPKGDDDPPGKVDDPVDEADEPPRPPCCEEGEEDCGPPWPWPWPETPEVPPPPEDNDSDRPPVGVPPSIPGAPAAGGAGRPDVIDIVPGIEIASTDVRAAPVSVPVFVPAPIGAPPVAVPAVGPGAGPAGAGPASGLPGAAAPAAPRPIGAAPQQAREPFPASVGGGATMPASGSRVGYGEYLRSAGISQIAALALPGLAGILVLTGAGGLLGYRQAKAGHGVRSSGIARFMN